jgi:hypothetical protein
LILGTDSLCDKVRGQGEKSYENVLVVIYLFVIHKKINPETKKMI